MDIHLHDLSPHHPGSAVARAAALLKDAGHQVGLAGPGGDPVPAPARPDLVVVLPAQADHDSDRARALGLAAHRIETVRATHLGVPVVVAGLDASLDPDGARTAAGADGSLPGAPERAIAWLAEACAADPAVLRPDRLGRVRPAWGRWDAAARRDADRRQAKVAEIAAQAARALNLGEAQLAGEGMEFAVFRAHSAEHGDVALRVPREPVVRYTGRDPFSARQALEQERTVAAHLHRHSLPVAEPLALAETPTAPVLASRFLPGAGAAPAPERIGELLARLHNVPVPRGLRPLDHDGWPFDVAIARRVSGRWRWLAQQVPDLPPLPGLEGLVPLLAPLAAEARLLHLDVRMCNLASVEGEVGGLFDWGCAMVGHPALELARIQANAALPENDLDLQALWAGYRRHGTVPALDAAVEAVLRLDGVLMLCVVFGAAIPDPDRLATLVEQARDLAKDVK
ncbi:phosphotransferase family protein [Streptomyces sp. NPDC127084]|uniref:phosphotransferase family protein n=1 Tax=Streptomyces sp. NPDC127084 TaxID=3347133 RepID=UPI00364E340C